MEHKIRLEEKLYQGGIFRGAQKQNNLSSTVDSLKKQPHLPHFLGPSQKGK